ncbi:Histone-lysine N-methyltransferase SETMAR [Anthophora plagiata]
MKPLANKYTSLIQHKVTERKKAQWDSKLRRFNFKDNSFWKLIKFFNRQKHRITLTLILNNTTAYTDKNKHNVCNSRVVIVDISRAVKVLVYLCGFSCYVNIRVFHKFFSHHARNDSEFCEYVYINRQAYLLAVYGIGFTRPKALLKYVLLVTQFSTPFNMDSQRKHLRHVMLHYFKKGNSAKDTADEICTVYGSGATTITTVRNWFKRFRAGNFELKDKGRSGRPATTDTDLIKAMLAKNPRDRVREIVDASNIPRTTTNLMNRVSTCDLLF